MQALFQSLVSLGWLSQAELVQFLNAPDGHALSIDALAERFPNRRASLNRCLSIALGLPWIEPGVLSMHHTNCTLERSDDNTHGTLRSPECSLQMLTMPGQFLRSAPTTNETKSLKLITEEGSFHQLSAERPGNRDSPISKTSTSDRLFTQKSPGSLAADRPDTSPEDAPAVKLLDQIFAAGVQSKASDIHVEIFNRLSRIRFRIDGRLLEHDTLSTHLHKQLISRLKILAELDITERRQPQDGRLSIPLRDHGTINMRLSILPTAWGEKAVIRIQSHANTVLPLSRLGMNNDQQQQVQTSITRHQGLVLVTGPTGSGKTQTLYAMLEQLNHIESNLVTLEDPVEIDLPGINQIAVSARSKMTFQHALKALLRQDPDVVMLGEIRDRETADTAIKAAQTGHLLLSTLHTNGCIESLVRLINLGVAPYQLSDTLTLVIAQRLLRKLCPHCKQPLKPDAAFNRGLALNLSPDADFREPVGCHACHQGYNGRVAIFEALPITSELSQCLADNRPLGDVRQCASQYLDCTLSKSAQTAWEQGLTSYQEIAPYLESFFIEAEK